MASLLGLVLALAGCACGPRAGAQSHGHLWNVSLPGVRLADSEYIQSFVVNIQGGRITSINRLLDDWGLELVWDRPGEHSLEYSAGHFVSGLESTADLNDFFPVEADSRLELRLTATIQTASTIPTGRPDREIAIGEKEMVLRSVSHRR